MPANPKPRKPRVASYIESVLPLKAAPQKGVPRHCICAQLFGANGLSVATIDTTADERDATELAKFIADSCNAKKTAPRVELSMAAAKRIERQITVRWHGLPPNERPAIDECDNLLTIIDRAIRAAKGRE